MSPFLSNLKSAQPILHTHVHILMPVSTPTAIITPKPNFIVTASKPVRLKLCTDEENVAIHNSKDILFYLRLLRYTWKAPIRKAHHLFLRLATDEKKMLAWVQPYLTY